MTDVPANSYDALPYSDRSYALTHPDRLAAIARLHGLTPPPVASCRVLELGCGLGGNLIPMAEWLPGAHFVGVDLSARQIETARSAAGSLGLANVEFLEADLATLELPEPFDYIICHGVYSWVPPAIQSAILRICGRHLTAQGVALISYNTNPGWRLKGLVRDMLLFAAEDEQEPLRRVQRGLDFLRFVGEAIPDSESWLARECRQILKELDEDDPTYVFHEYLETCNIPITVTEFIGRAAAAGLAFVDEANMNAGVYRLAPEVQQSIRQLAADPVRYQQCIDFILARSFRQSLLCHDRCHPAPLSDPGAIRGLSVLGTCVPSGSDPAKPGVESFRGTLRATMSTDNPLVKAACHALFEALPEALPFPVLRERVRDRVAGAGVAWSDADEEADLIRPLLSCVRAGLMELHTHQPRLARSGTGAPLALLNGRQRAGQGKEVTNAWHSRVQLDELHRAVLARLDGKTDRAALQAVCREVARRLGQDGDPAVMLDRVLDALARQAFLMAAPGT